MRPSRALSPMDAMRDLWAIGVCATNFEQCVGGGQRSGLRVIDSFGLQNGEMVRWLPNLRAGTSVYKLER